KGFDAPLQIHRVTGMGGRFDLSLPEDTTRFVELSDEIPVRFALLEGKDVSPRQIEGRVWAGSPNGAKIRSAEVVEELRNIQIQLVESGHVVPGGCSAKVVQGSRAVDGS
ncbi:unnamed protein product, partial [marine sediment metagenome]